MRFLHADSYLKAILYRLGYETVRSAPLDLREVADNPIYASYLAGRRRCLLTVPLAFCRDALGFSFAQKELQPFVRTVLAYLDGKAITYETSPLKEFYEHFQPSNLWEFFELPGDPSGELALAAPAARIFPWEASSLRKRTRWRAIAARLENRDRGQDVGLEHGDVVGPVTDKKGALEFRALVQLADSIRTTGYTRSDVAGGDITAMPLIDSKQGVRYLVKGGNHRIAVLAALSCKSVPIRLKLERAPRVEEASHWPHVRDGLFRREHAIQLFQRIFGGSPPTAAVPTKWTARRPVELER